jgi:hypothetical protein
MPLPRDFEKTLAERTDEQLCDMLAHAGDYQPEAVAAARAEMQRRNLTPTQVTELDAHSQAIRAHEQDSAQRPLGWVGRITIFILAFSLVSIAITAFVAEAFRNRGFTRKHKECWTWTWYGLGFWLTSGAAFGGIGLIIDRAFRAQDLSVTMENVLLAVTIILSAGIGAGVVTLVAWLRRRAA